MATVTTATSAIVDPSQIELVIAGTLALMTRYPGRPCTCVSERISSNLLLLAECQFLSPTLRSLCDRLKTDWQETTSTLYGEMVAHQLEHATLQ